jgi:protein-disulfide isomerase
MRLDRKTSVLLLAGALAVAPAGAADKAKAAAQAKAAAAPAGALATVDGEPLTDEDLAKAGGARYQTFKSQEYAAKRDFMEGAIGQKLLENEAKRRNVTVDELKKQEIESKVEPVTDVQAKEFYDMNKARFGQLTEPEALDQIHKGLAQQRLQRKLSEYVGALRAKASVKVLLDPYRIDVAADDDPAKGPATAPVTLVEFSDFQCPYCARVGPALKRVEEVYGDQVRIVFKDFPLLQIHNNAAKAAEAGSCANEQGKFWALHDKMFENQSKLSVAEIKQHAKEAGLDANAFDQCLDSGKQTAEWTKDLADGEKYGVTGTPAFFVNGRLLGGAASFEKLAEVIDDELSRRGLPVPDKASVKPSAAPAPPASATK